MDLVIFPGNRTPLKRYRCYFPMFLLREVKEGETPNQVLAHSLGLRKAVEYCVEHKIQMRIVCLDGVQLTEPPPEGVNILLFRPIEKKGADDEQWYDTIIYYSLPEQVRHYPYMNKHVRDKIVTELR
jgi:hypothetical protein